MKPAERFCDTETDKARSCTRPDLFAFQVCSGIMMIFMGGNGFKAWHYKKTAHKFKTPEGRLFGFIDDADHLLAGIAIYQIWDFLVSLLIEEMKTPIFLGHHLLSGLTALFSLEYQMMHHYAIFFGGCSEISSLFLVICDFNEYFPAEWMKSGVWETVVFFCQASFTLTFFYYRIIAWILLSWPLWKDVMYVTRHKKSKKDGVCLAEQYRPNKKWWFLFFFLAMDAILGALQVYWFVYGILPKIIEILQ